MSAPVIDDGRQARLRIPNVADCTCGISRNVMSFTPNLPGNPGNATVGSLDGLPIRFTSMQAAGDGSWLARWEEIA